MSYVKLLHFANQCFPVQKKISFNNCFWAMQLITKSSAIKINTIYNRWITKINRTISCTIFLMTNTRSFERNWITVKFFILVKITQNWFQSYHCCTFLSGCIRQGMQRIVLNQRLKYRHFLFHFVKCCFGKVLSNKVFSILLLMLLPRM